MANFSGIYSPKSKTGGFNDSQQSVLAGAGTATVTLNVRQLIRISVCGTTPAATGLVAVRFSLAATGATTAVATDFQLPAGVYDFMLGDEFDTVNLYGVAACVVSIMRITP